MLLSLVVAFVNRILMPRLVAVEKAAQLRRDGRVLASLDARALADIGIGPSEIDGALRCGRADRPPERADLAAGAPSACWG